ncbi:MAG TPA: HNH endonuclease [Pirellulales bacterium]|nr:HNH endonuclease [Pirellulales bacterium]
MNRRLHRFVWRRADSICEYCRIAQEWDILTFQVDHVIALKHGGRTVADNLALACYTCNSLKGPNVAGIDPTTGMVATLFHPRLDLWGNHFEWNGPVLVGLTPTGRATIAVLGMNASQRVRLRRALIGEGVFPP